jgi:hypothetical protein
MLYEIRVLYQTLSPAFTVKLLTAAGMISGNIQYIRTAIYLYGDKMLMPHCNASATLAFCKPEPPDGGICPSLMFDYR